MEDILFQNEFIIWTSPWISSLWISIGAFLAILFLLLWRKYRKSYTPPEVPNPYIYIDTTDPEFPAKTLYALKKYLLERKKPYHVIAHTAEEIHEYIDNPDLIKILQELEHREYSGEPITPSQSIEYNERIKNIIT